MTRAWTADDVRDLSGTVVVITGANSGIGLEAAKVVAANGAHTVLACRNPDKAAGAVAEVRQCAPDATVEAMSLDVASLASVRAFAEAFRARFDRLDMLVNNAGIMMVPFALTEDGFESQLGTNHLGHFALTGLLLDRLLAVPGARVVDVSSHAHRFGAMDFDDLHFTQGRRYGPARAYGQSKLANLLFTYELQRRFEAAGVDATALAAHPGGARTQLARHYEDRWYFKPLVPVIELFIQSAAMGALPTLRALGDPEARGGEYYGPGGFQEQSGYPVKVSSTRASHDTDAARKLWEASEALTGVTFAWPAG